VTPDSKPLVLCLVGTDHHQFERLVSWCDTLATSRRDVDVFVQHGLSRAPTAAKGRDFLSREELDSLLRRARVAVSHGGPGLISEIRAAGLHPICVPRDPDLGEHVDRHQLRFVDRLAKDGQVDLITSKQLFLDLIDWRLAQPHVAPVDTVRDEARLQATVDCFANLVEGLFDHPAAGQALPERRRTGLHQA
jgi:UDP-N-acetylglucosamine transferase subunit ALG13